MSLDNQQDQKKNKKPIVQVKLEWIFGIRKDIYPNIYYVTKGTIAYPASHYVVIYNYDLESSDRGTDNKVLIANNTQHFIAGEKHSKGITAIAATEFVTKLITHSYVAVGEKLKATEKRRETSIIKFYRLSKRSGLKNIPELLRTLDFGETIIDKILAMKFLTYKKDERPGFFVALGVSYIPSNVPLNIKPGLSPQKNQQNKIPMKTKFYLIVKVWEQSTISTKEYVNEITDLPPSAKKCKKFELSFSSLNTSQDEENKTILCIGCEKFLAFYDLTAESLSSKSAPEPSSNNYGDITEGKEELKEYAINFNQTYVYKKGAIKDEEIDDEDMDEESEENSWQILSHCWLNSTHVACLTNEQEKIEIIKTEVKENESHICTEELLDQPIITEKTETEGDYTVLAPYITEKYEGFIAAGTKGKLHFYLKKIDDEKNPNDSDDDDDMDDELINEEQRRRKAQQYTLKFKKDINYDFVPGINEPINSDKQPGGKSAQSDKIFNYHSIVSMEDTQFIFATTNNNDLIKITTDRKTIRKGPVEYCISPFHSDSVVGLDCCINKPYLITCSKDHSVKVWDYMDRVQLLTKTYDEDLFSISFHPSGMHALLSAEDKILHLAIYYDAIESKKNQNVTLKAKCKDLKFSNLGHLFAFDSGTTIQIYDFLNMQIFTGPPDIQPHVKNFANSTQRINCLSWASLDKDLYIGGAECLFDWKLKDDPYSSIKKPNKNYLSVIYSDQERKIIASSDDQTLTKFDSIGTEGKEEKLEFSVTELNTMTYTDVLFCATVNNNDSKQEKSGGNIINLQQNGKSLENRKDDVNTTCLCVFYDYMKSTQHLLLPSHHGETKRVRLNNEGTKVFTCGEDGCINVYNIELPGDYFGESTVDTSSKFTATVLIDKSSNKTRETNKKDLPAKREDLLKKTITESADNQENKNRELEEYKNKNAEDILKIENEIHEMEEKKKNGMIIDEEKIKKKQEDFKNDYETQKRKNQLEVAKKTKEVDEIRENQRKVNEDGILEKNRREEENRAKVERIKEEFEKEKKKKEENKAEIQGKIEKVKKDKIEDGKALEEINNQIIDKIGNNVAELRRKIDELSNHYGHDIKKKKDEMKKLETEGQILILEEKKLQEDINRLEKDKKKQEEDKKDVEEEMAEITKRISEIENKIIECKKSHTYLEKCKFVLSYKIQELKKEAGPMEKVLEDLQKRTKEDELSLSKYNREFDIISHKVVNLEDLKEKTKAHERTERDLKNEINSFKIDLQNMLAHIDDFDKLKEGFRELREKYLKSYQPDVQDHELEGEFANQKSKMKNRVLELQEDLVNLRKKHKENIRDNRDENNVMIGEIQNLKKNIKDEKKKREAFNGDQKHANAVAEIKAGEYIKQLMMQDISISDKIKLFQKKKEIKNEELEYLKREVKIYSIDGKEINEDGEPLNQTK